METKAINTKLKGHARVDVADVLRGLAVMGIIILHSIEHFNFYSFPDTAGQSAWLNFSDRTGYSSCSAEKHTPYSLYFSVLAFLFKMTTNAYGAMISVYVFVGG